MTKIVVVAPGALLWLKIGSWYRLVRTFSSWRLIGAGVPAPRPAGAWPPGRPRLACRWGLLGHAATIAAAPAATMATRTSARFMRHLRDLASCERKQDESRMHGNLSSPRSRSTAGATSTASLAGCDPTCANHVTLEATQSSSRRYRPACCGGIVTRQRTVSPGAISRASLGRAAVCENGNRGAFPPRRTSARPVRRRRIPRRASATRRRRRF